MSMFRELLSAALIIMSLASCRAEADTAAAQAQETVTAAAETQTAADNEEETKETMLGLAINGTPVSAEWEDNESVQELRKLAAEEPIVIQMSMYGGFEQVGSLGKSIARNDVQTTASAGDIVLYSGSNIVIFYGSNSWAYTRLGHIMGKTAGELSELLGNGDVTITISVI